MQHQIVVGGGERSAIQSVILALTITKPPVNVAALAPTSNGN
jgi:hypothetical protein